MVLRCARFARESAANNVIRAVNQSGKILQFQQHLFRAFSIIVAWDEAPQWGYKPTAPFASPQTASRLASFADFFLIFPPMRSLVPS